MGCCGKFFKCLIYIICLPITLLISAVGFLIWLPIKILGCICPCCCACTCILECAENIFENMVKMPFNCCMWVGDQAAGDGGSKV